MNPVLEQDTSSAPGRTERALELLESRRALVLTFILLHAVFLAFLLPAIVTGDALGDLPLYRQWVMGGVNVNEWPVLSYGWVYPAGALIPIIAATLAGPASFQLLWFAMTATLNAASVSCLVQAAPTGRRRYAGAQWWMVVLLITSPVALLRLEGIAAPLAIIGLALLARRPFAASIVLSVATWIKVWPAAILMTIVASSRRWVTIAWGALTVTAGIVVVVSALGGFQFLASFVTMQSDRTLQVEAPISTAWLWMSDLRIGDAFIWQDQTLSTEEVTGPGADTAALIMTPLMIVAVASILILIIVARRRGVPAATLIVNGSLALSTALVVFNKVGSPQYILWIAPIVAFGCATSWAAWRTPAILTLVIATLTSLVFPVFYMPLLDGDLAAASILTARNALLIALLAWSVRNLALLGRAALPVREAADGKRSVPSLAEPVPESAPLVLSVERRSPFRNQ